MCKLLWPSEDLEGFFGRLGATLRAISVKLNIHPPGLRIGYHSIYLISLFYFLVSLTYGRYSVGRMLDLRGLPDLLPAWILPVLLWFGAIAIEAARRRVDRPSRAIWKLAKRNRSWLARGALFTLIAIPIAKSFGSLKVAIPNLNKFYADPYLISIDKYIFGKQAWVITHNIIGDNYTVYIDRIYAIWFFVIMILLGFLNFSRNEKLQIRGLLSYILTIAICGNFLAVIFASVGPCFVNQFYQISVFDPLMSEIDRIDASQPLLARKAMRFLLATQGTERFGSGISAMPSVHVGMAFLAFLVTLKGSRMLWLKVLAGAFAATILVGSVHLGWHYAVDGIVSIIVVTLIWIGAGRFVDWVEWRESAAAPTTRIAGGGLVAEQAAT